MSTFTVTTLQDVVDADDGRLSLREAVRRANATDAADTIVFRPALEGGTVVLRGSQLTVREDVRIDGDRDEAGARTTIDADEGSRVVEIGGIGTEASLDGLTITGGLVDGDGAGVLLGAGNRLALTESRVVDNASFDYSAGFYGDGGGIFAARGSRLSIVDSSVTDNQGIAGGGIHATQGTDVLVQRSTVERNVGADYRNGYGGGLYLEGASATIVASTIAENVADGNGAGIFADSSRLAITDSTISGNEGQYRLGGGQGGGIYARDGSDISLTHTTVTGNSSGSYAGYARGGGIFIEPASDYAGELSTLSFANSIVAGNFNGDPGDRFSDARAEDIDGRITESNEDNVFGTVVTGNAAGDVEGVAPGRIFAAIDPETGGGRLASNGGPTETVRLRDSANNPALDAVFNTDGDGFDQRGFARPRPEDTRPDIGAFELNQRGGRAQVASVDGDDDLVFDFGDGGSAAGDDADLAGAASGARPFALEPTFELDLDRAASDGDVLL